jgi:NADH:ubiquinone oxidoreductase subunit E
MPSDNDSAEIVICLGSACFARGNCENLAILEQYVQNHGADASVRMTGRLCQDQCKDGPNLMIGGKLYHNVTAARLRELLQQIGSPSRVEHETV